MMITTVLWALLLGAGLYTAAQDNAAPAIACNLKAIGAAERPRYNDLMRRLQAAVRNRSEVRDGYTFKLSGKTISLPEVAEWIGMERLCCPFLMLQLSASGNQTDWVLKVTGPVGVKSLLEAEFPAR